MTTTPPPVAPLTPAEAAVLAKRSIAWLDEQRRKAEAKAS